MVVCVCVGGGGGGVNRSHTKFILGIPEHLNTKYLNINKIYVHKLFLIYLLF